MIFDVLVVGETPAAMTVAALLVRKGLKVAWVTSPTASPAGEGGHPGPKVPDMVWDLLPRTLVRNVLERLGVPYKHLEKGGRHGGGIQMVTPEFRTGFLDGLHGVRRELKRIFGLDDPDLDKIFPEMAHGTDDDFFKKYWGQIFRKLPGKKAQIPLLGSGESIVPSPLSVDGIRAEPALRRFFELGVYAQSYLSQWVFPKTLVRHFLRNFSHLNIFAQGRLVSPEKIFREVFSMGGGEFFHVEGDFLLEPHREKGISLWLGDDQVVNGTVCLLAISPEAAPTLFERLHVPSRRWESKDNLGDMAYKIGQINFSIDPAGIPGGMGENLILFTEAATNPFSPTDLAFLTLEKPEEAPWTGQYTVFYEQAFAGEEIKAWTARQISRLERLFPFMTSHLNVTDVSVARGDPLSLGSYYHYGTRKRRLGTPRLKETLLGKNFFFIGRRQLDYMGLEGEIITALKAIHWALDRLTKL